MDNGICLYMFAPVEVLLDADTVGGLGGAVTCSILPSYCDVSLTLVPFWILDSGMWIDEWTLLVFSKCFTIDKVHPYDRGFWKLTILSAAACVRNGRGSKIGGMSAEFDICLLDLGCRFAFAVPTHEVTSTIAQRLARRRTQCLRYFRVCAVSLR